MKIWVKDNFLEDPELARLIANTGDFVNCVDQTEYHWNDLKTTAPRDTRAQNALFGDIIGEEVILVENDVRKFNICLERPDKKTHIHHDDCDYIGVVYLDEPKGPEDGTLLLTHKETGIFYKDEERFGTEVSQDADWNSDSADITKWDTRMFIPMRYNRLVIFEPRYYHTEGRTFGQNPEEGRCVEIFHMVKRSRKEYWMDFWKEEIESGFYSVPKEAEE